MASLKSDLPSPQTWSISYVRVVDWGRQEDEIGNLRYSEGAKGDEILTIKTADFCYLYVIKM